MITNTKTKISDLKIKLIDSSEELDSIKKQLLKIAKIGNKPLRKSFFGRHLYSFTNKDDKLYDEKFTQKIKELRPDWFVLRSVKKSKKYKKSKNTVEKNRNVKFLSKFKCLITLMKRDVKEIYTKEKLSELFRLQNRSKIAAHRYASRMMMCFESEGLVFSCDEKGNLDKRSTKRYSRGCSKIRYWRLSEDIFEKLGISFNKD